LANFQPPPTYAEVVVYDKAAKDSAALLRSAKFNPIWLKWFLDLVKGLGSSGAGSGTVSVISVVAANGISGSVANPTTTPAITLALGDITPNKVSATSYIRPGTPAGAGQTATGIYAGTGVPNNADGQNGDYYFRSDGGVGTHIYYRSAGAWAGVI
jgi:hypothetical protein